MAIISIRMSHRSSTAIHWANKTWSHVSWYPPRHKRPWLADCNLNFWSQAQTQALLQALIHKLYLQAYVRDSAKACEPRSRIPNYVIIAWRQIIISWFPLIGRDPVWARLPWLQQANVLLSPVVIHLTGMSVSTFTIKLITNANHQSRWQIAICDMPSRWRSFCECSTVATPKSAIESLLTWRHS
jgi:hypothetical protein